MAVAVAEVQGVVSLSRAHSSKPRVCSPERPCLPTSRIVVSDMYIRAHGGWRRTAVGSHALRGSAP